MKPVLTARLLEQSIRIARERHRGEELSPEQWAALRYLSIAGERSRTFASLSSYLGISESRMQKAVNGLQEASFISRHQPRASRFEVISLTASGLDALRSDPVLFLASAITAIDSENQSKLATLLEQLCEKLTDADETRSRRAPGSNRSRRG